MLRFFGIFNHLPNPINREKGYQTDKKQIHCIAYHWHCFERICKKVSDGVKQRCHV